MLPPKNEMLRTSPKRLLSDKLLQHHDVLCAHELLCDDVLRAGSHVLRTGGDMLWRSAKLLRSGVERHCGSGSAGGGPRPGSGPLRLTEASRADRPGSRSGRCLREPGLCACEGRRCHGTQRRP